jgi:hypothetical protein
MGAILSTQKVDPLTSPAARLAHTVAISRLLDEVGDELSRALSLFPVFNSPHEGKAVIEEELDELWEHVKASSGRSAEARTETIQLAAMAMRYALDLCAEDQP